MPPAYVNTLYWAKLYIIILFQLAYLPACLPPLQLLSEAPEAAGATAGRGGGALGVAAARCPG